MVSDRFRILTDRIKTLRRAFLPIHFDPTGQYGAEVHEHTHAFVVFSHAEFESYLEAMALNRLEEILRSWGDHAQPSYGLASLLAFHAKQKPDESPLEALKTAVAGFKVVVEQNNGVKRKNIRSLLCPIGYVFLNTDEAWLSDLDSFGATRGSSVHLSGERDSTGRIRDQRDPETEYKLVMRLVDHLAFVDARLCDLPLKFVAPDISERKPSNI